MRRHILLFIVFIMIITSFMTLAQDEDTTCPTIVQEAVAYVADLCTDTGRNQACYGNLTLIAEAQPDIDDLEFDSPGDIEDVVKIQSLALNGMDEDIPEWGVAMMRLQANLPDTLPGQNVTILLFGDVDIRADPLLLEMQVTVSAGNTINVRGGPSTGYAVVGQIQSESTITANGRNDAGDWIRVSLPDDEGIGWVAVFLIDSEGDLNTLEIVDTNASLLTPMQAFYFRSGVGDSACAEAPDSGIMIQTPQGVGKVAITVNGVGIALGSTAFLQAERGDSLIVNVVEGQAEVSSFDEVKVVPEGAQVAIPIDEELVAAGPPEEPQPYDEDELGTLPGELLERDIDVATSATDAEIRLANSCIVIALGQVSIYGGPGTNYGVIANLAADENVLINGQDDGGLWWRINTGAWIRSGDFTQASAACDRLPSIDVSEPIPTGTPPPDIEREGNSFVILHCYTKSGPILAGQQVSLTLGIGWPTRDLAETELPKSIATIMVDGVLMDASSPVPLMQDSQGFVSASNSTWIAIPGTHVIS
jgi:uncharacterized protein YraI